ncbi:chitin synthase-domain-containing protein [Zychaea mexicana]|uniref:chitin synthase-domain-containing protein n=1 Tax=Zychaea mexicana TaxID=64656 RepID=UPI0022FF097C|nr:chitin synthase-domain-containing protein [Zychaea mexicana]KAI9489097.1 chitin synthase-domain-containing protein [Zychaea mexicana]
MRRRADDVGIVLSGSTGSGKSTTHHHLLSQLLHLSAQSRREAKLRRYILSAQTIIDAFSTAATPDNANASHLHQFQTLYFNERGRILGLHTAVYLLDKQRVTATTTSTNSEGGGSGGANYSIFYQLLAGTTAQEKAALHINYTADHFAYLKDPQGHQHRNALAWTTSLAARDEVAFADFKAALKTCGFKAKTIAQICQLLGAILHLGNIQFVGNNQSCKIKNKDTLSLVAAALGVATTKLEATLTHKLKLLGKEFCTAFLTADAATVQRDALARSLYTILVLWIVDVLNQHYPTTSDQCISILDPANGISNHQQQRTAGFIDLCSHFCAERIHQFIITKPHLLDAPPPITSSLSVYLGNQGLVSLLDRESERLEAYALDATDANFLSLLLKKQQPRVVSKRPQTFAIQHFTGPVEYKADGLLESNLDALSPDFILLFRYSCTNTFLRELFESSVLVTEMHPRDERTIIKAQLPARPKHGQWRPTDPVDESSASNGKMMMTVLDQTVHSMDRLIDRLKTMQLFEVLHIRPNDQQKPDLFDPTVVQSQLVAHKMADRAKLDPMYSYEFADFLNRYHYLLSMLPFDDESQEDERAKIIKLIHVMQWTSIQVDLGKTCIWIAFDVWRDLENHLRALEKEQRIPAAAAAAAAEHEATEGSDPDQNPFGDDHDCGASDMYTTDNDFYDDRTEVGDQYGGDSMGKHSTSQWGEDDDMDGYMDLYGPNMDMSKMVEDYCVQQEELIEEVPITPIRQWWARFVWFCTWWIPSVALRYIGKMDRQDVRMAWREKVTLCILIFTLSASIVFVIVGLGEVICPGTKDLYTAQDVQNHQTIDDYWISVRGKVYEMTDFVANTHGSNAYVATKSTLEPLAGRDLSYTFPPPLTQACQGLVTDDSITITPNETIVLGPFVHYSGNQQSEKSMARMRDPDWLKRYFDPVMGPNKHGDLVISKKQLEGDFQSWGRLALAMNGKIYDLTDYMATAHKYPRDAVGVPNYHFLNEAVELMFTKYAGTDATEMWEQFSWKMTEEERAQNLACLDNAFHVARLDYRDSLRCTFVNYLLLSFAVVTSLVILVKFLAALQFGGAPTPEEQDKFVICQVPCYTEDEESLRKTIDSLTTMDYDDKRKLLFLIADGMIIGSGNDKPTPMILLDILGHDDKEDPEPVMFKSVGEGSKQLNYGKVYSGLYMHEGHCVPYVVVIKVGKSTERNKPGNRGKRDSQIICMDFLRKVHFDSEMTPLELSIYHNIRNVIGVDPALYEYILMVDSDTEVYPDALTRLVSCMLHDSRIIGLCGETELCNEDCSWTTRIQVYEYYISHHLVKAFESLFGSVTCLPGCFCMYRVRTASKRQPLIVSPAIIHGYSDNQVDTLHKKNLLHLGEDRYLTTLMMKNFPEYKMMFTPYARCRTVAPDRWQVLLSQRRRWINSTIHNLLELILLPELCGFCCLSMRFVVMIDLIGTITLPASVIYLAYLIYVVAANTGPIPVIALGMLAGAYGLQALIFIIKRQWQHIGWMVIYLMAIPVFSFLIPIYAFWHFDDFSWGNTRVVVGDKKKQIIVTEDEKFDDKMIPLKKWEQHEREMLETRSIESDETRLTNYTYDSRPASASYRQEEGADGNEEHLPRLTTGLSERRLSQFSVDLSAVLQQPQQQRHRNKQQEDSGSVAGSKSGSDGDDDDTETKVILPEDDEIERELRRILAGANLMTLTKKQVRNQLSQRFGVDLTIKKGFINSAIERILENEM